MLLVTKLAYSTMRLFLRNDVSTDLALGANLVS